MWTVQQSIKHPIGITVYGSALLRTEPDVAVATIAISRVAKEPAESFKAARAAVQSVRDSLTETGIEPSALEVSRVSIEDAFEGFGPTRKFVGYRASVTFRVRIHDVELVEPLLVGAVAAGANQIQGVSYQTTKLRELREDVRRRALQAARRKADVYSEAASCRVGPVVHIEDVDPDKALQASGHAGGRTSSEEADADDMSTLGSGSLTVAAAVMVAYALLPQT